MTADTANGPPDDGSAPASNLDAAARPLDAPLPAPEAVGGGQDPSMAPVDQALCQCPPDPDQAPAASEVPRQGSAYDELIAPGSNIGSMERLTDEALQRHFLRRQNVPREDVRGLHRFDDNAPSVTAGQYVVTVNRAQFTGATAAVCEAAGLSKAGGPKGETHVRICLSQFQMKFRMCGPDFAFETTLPVEHIVLGISDMQQIAFSFDLRHLRNLARLTADDDETLTATYRADLRKLIIRSELTSVDQAKLKLSTWSADGFGGVHMEQLNAITYVRPLDTSVLKKGLEFLALFATSKADRPDLQVVEIRNGSIVGGLYDRIGVVGSDKPMGSTLRSTPNIYRQ